jgi:hypothetical protein
MPILWSFIGVAAALHLAGVLEDLALPVVGAVLKVRLRWTGFKRASFPLAAPLYYSALTFVISWSGIRIVLSQQLGHLGPRQAAVQAASGLYCSPAH